MIVNAESEMRLGNPSFATSTIRCTASISCSGWDAKRPCNKIWSPGVGNDVLAGSATLVIGVAAAAAAEEVSGAAKVGGGGVGDPRVAAGCSVGCSKF